MRVSPRPLRVISTLCQRGGTRAILKAREQAHIRAFERMEVLVDEAKAAGVEAEFVLYDGSPERAMRQRAADWGADLVVIGRRGHTGLGELFLGSVSNNVLHRVPCPVLVLQGERLERNAAEATASSESLPAERAPVS